MDRHVRQGILHPKTCRDILSTDPVNNCFYSANCSSDVGGLTAACHHTAKFPNRVLTNRSSKST